MVSTHALAKSATPSLMYVGRSGTMSFNPRAREERDKVGGIHRFASARVSTHALAKSATPHVTVRTQRRCRVSTHALAKSATVAARVLALAAKFQPTRSRRARRGERRQGFDVRYVSTHALAKSATRRDAHRRQVGICFNPRAREERDLSHRVSHGSREVQPTRSRRARPDELRPYLEGWKFQPMRSRRARLGCEMRLGKSSMFQPTRSRRARRRAHSCGSTSSICFNPRAREERDVAQPFGFVLWSVSTHALAKSATSEHGAAKRSARFQPTRSRRARPEDDSGSGGGHKSSNPRAREERDRDRFHDR